MQEQNQEQSGQEAKSWYLAMLWALSFGLVGGHRLYTGRMLTGCIQLVLHLSGWSLVFMATTRSLLGLSLSDVSMWINLWFLTSVLWLLIDIGLLLAGRFRDKAGEPLKRKSGDLQRIGIGVGLAILCVYSAVYILPGFVKAKVIPDNFYRMGGIFMHPIRVFWMLLIGTTALSLPYLWRHRRLPISMAAVLMIVVFSIPLLGLIGSHFGLIEANAAIQSATSDQAHRLLMDYLSITLITQSFAYLLLSMSLPIIALTWALLSIRKAPRRWGHGGMGLLLIGGVVGVAWLWCQPLRQHILQLASTAIGLLALVLALLPAHQEDETAKDSVTNALPALLIAFVLLGILSGGLFSDMQFFSRWTYMVNHSDATNMGSFQLLALRYPSLWRLLYLSLAGGALVGVWLFLSGSSRQRSGKAIALLAGCLVCTIGLLLWRSNIYKSMVKPVLAASTTQAKSTTAAQEQSRATIPWTAALQQKTNTLSLRIKTLHHLLLVTANSKKRTDPTAIAIENKQISLDGKMIEKPSLAAKANPSHPYLVSYLQEELAYLARKRKKIAKFNKTIKFHGKLALDATPQTSFRMLAKVLYSAHKAGFGRPFFRMAQRRKITYGKQSITVLHAQHRFPIHLAFQSPLTGKVLPKPHQAPVSFLLELVLDAKGARLYRAKRPTKAGAPPQVAAPKPQGADKSGTSPPTLQPPKRKALWQEARKPHLTMTGLQEALTSFWKTTPPGQRLVLLRCAPKIPYYETLGAVAAIATEQKTYAKPMVWLAPTTAHEAHWTR